MTAPIRIRPETREKIERLKSHPRDTLDDVLTVALEELEKVRKAKRRKRERREEQRSA